MSWGFEFRTICGGGDLPSSPMPTLEDANEYRDLMDEICMCMTKHEIQVRDVGPWRARIEEEKP